MRWSATSDRGRDSYDSNRYMPELLDSTHEAGGLRDEIGGAGSAEHCAHCDQEGSFTQPNPTLDLMVDGIASAMGQTLDAETRAVSRAALSGLILWQGG